MQPRRLKKTVTPQVKRQKPHESDSNTNLSGDLSDLSAILDVIAQNEENTKKAVDITLSKECFKSSTSEFLLSEIKCLKDEVKSLNARMEEMEQYSRRTCLKFAGIVEGGKEENTDELVLNVINILVLHPTGITLGVDRIGRTHKVGPPPRSKDDRPRDIIVRFLSYRDRALVFRNKKNLKSYNSNSCNASRIFINEALTHQRTQLYGKARRLVRENKILSAWTHDGKVMVKNFTNRILVVRSDDDNLNKLLPKVTSDHNPRMSYASCVKGSHNLTSSSTSNVSVGPLNGVDHITSTPLPKNASD